MTTYQEPLTIALLGIPYITEYQPGAGVTIDGVLARDLALVVATIQEFTAAAGVTINGVLYKDAAVTDTDLSTLRINALRATIPTAIVGGSSIYLDSGANTTAGDLMVRQNDGATTKDQCIMGWTNQTDASYTGATLSSSPTNGMPVSLSLVEGTYLVSIYCGVSNAENIVFYCYLDDSTNPVVASILHMHKDNTWSHPMQKCFILTAAATGTYRLRVHASGSDSNPMILMQTVLADGVSVAFNRPNITVWRIA